jgi:hypothetical protein
MKIMGKMWSDLDESSKKKYYDLAAKDKIRYEEEMKVFEANHPDLARKGESPKPRKIDGFNIFSKEMTPSVKEEFPDLSDNDIIHLLASKWADASKDGTSAKYIEMANKANAKFPELITAFYADPANRKYMTKKELENLDNPDLNLNPETGRFVKKAPTTPKIAKAPQKVPKAPSKAVPKVFKSDPKQVIKLDFDDEDIVPDDEKVSS